MNSGTVIFVSHDMTAITELCSRVIWIENARIRMDGTPKWVTEKYLEYIYGGDEKFAKQEEKIHSPLKALDSDGFIDVNEEIRQFGDGKILIRAIRFICSREHKSVAYSGEQCRIDL